MVRFDVETGGLISLVSLRGAVPTKGKRSDLQYRIYLADTNNLGSPTGLGVLLWALTHRRYTRLRAPHLTIRLTVGDLNYEVLCDFREGMSPKL